MVESELEQLNPKSHPQTPPPPPEPITGDASTAGTQNSNLTIEEMEEKFAAYVRHDVYGTMGRGELPWTEKVLLGVALVTVVPVRVVLATAVLVVYYLICRLCTMFSDPNREDEQEDYANMRGWRRAVIVQSGKFLARCMLFVLGFYSIEESYRNPYSDSKLNTEVPLSWSNTAMVNYMEFLLIMS